tara:strand:+ start:739 stop:3747 length:3009 start_codon:yes stop_codon:yes gene_type:complete
VKHLKTGLLLCTLSILNGDLLDHYWQQRVDYKMDVTLHDSLFQLAGRSIIKYTNNSPDSLDRIYIHLYPNAFQLGSVKDREYSRNYGRASRAKYFKDKLKGFNSKIKIHDFNLAKKGEPVLKKYSIYDTILKASLNRKLAPGEILRIDISWTHHVGEMVERAGYYGGQYNMAQWYPKMAVYDEEGWHADVFHAEGEFYGEFGNFEVKFDLPKTFIIGASGIVIDGDPGWSDVTVDTTLDYSIWSSIFDSTFIQSDPIERRQVTFFAENVHDFAWVSGPDLRYEHGNWRDIDVHVLYHKARGQEWSRDVLKRSILALSWLEDKFGDYPYPQVTTTDRLKSGGMEYPMLVMNGSESEGLIVHEIGHIYFYGILANNEVDEAWMDEGFTTNQTRNYMMGRYGSHGYDIKLYDKYGKFPNKHWPMGNSLHSSQWYAIDFMRSGHDEPISRSSYLYLNGSSYRQNAYTKPALMLNELNYILGDSLYYSAMQYYYDNWKLKHVNELRFIKTMEEFTGQDLDWFFNPWLHTTRHLDYGISSYKKSKIEKSSKWKIDLKIECVGDRFLPLLVETEFQDGSVDRRWWKNQLWRFDDTFSYIVGKEPVSVALDPDVQTVDLDYRNNVTKMKYHIMFNWPGNQYNPRDQYVLRWMPYYYYNSDAVDFAPGFTMVRDYGPYESSTVRANYALASKNIYWYVGGWREPVHILPRTKIQYWTFNRPGVKEFGGEIKKQWNRVYGRTPTHSFSSGFYIQSEYDSVRAVPLGYSTDGQLAVGYLDWDGKFGSLRFDLNGASTIGSYSTWKFNRVTATGLYNKSWKNLLSLSEITPEKKVTTQIRFKQRVIAGKIWTNEKGIPGQEGYNIEGNSSNELLRKNYLVDQFYGQQDLFSHYHFPGEGNLRGFVGQGERGAEALTTFTTEWSIYFKIVEHDINIEIAAFNDGGFFWDRPDLTKSNYVKRTLLDGGLGFRFNTSIFEQDLYLRIDIPFFTYNDSRKKPSQVDWNNWIISFQRSI